MLIPDLVELAPEIKLDNFGQKRKLINSDSIDVCVLNIKLGEF